MRAATALSLAFVFVLATACGGGGSSGGGTTTGGGTGGGGGGGGGVAPPGASMTTAEEQLGMDALTAINNHRASVGGLPALQWYAGGADVAYAHCVAMEAGGWFAHQNPSTGSTPARRSADAGIAHDPQGSIEPGTGLPFVGENLASATGFPSVTYTGQQAVDGWIASPGHLAQIVAPNNVPTVGSMPAWTHCTIGVRVTTTQIWYTAMFWRNPTP